MQLQLLEPESLHVVHLRRAVGGQLADELDALGVELVNGRDPALLLVVDALALGVGQRIGIGLLALGGLGSQTVLELPRPLDGGLVHALDYLVPRVQDPLADGLATVVERLQLINDVERRHHPAAQGHQGRLRLPGAAPHLVERRRPLVPGLGDVVAGGPGLLSDLADGPLQTLCRVGCLVDSLSGILGGIRHLLQVVDCLLPA
ncbi:MULTISPECIES: hypothetical protein [Akkermansia]|uniref:hypothetical protein n=1 Tax=Akkermansia sp. TaxID=1872421 RepID=UPI001BFF85A0|nr:hypothetical protein [Candidatus Akkermansia timonensis]QWO91815.1 hypothetical protein J5W64_05240 [Candidatus Akkermansia timonensis]QWO92914.1 hypothetical protein J5W56_10455 [Candidatus Akkermansia timonensis]